VSRAHSRDVFSRNDRHASLGLAALVGLAMVAPLQLACGGGPVATPRADPFGRAAATRAAAELQWEGTEFAGGALGGIGYLVGGCGGSRTLLGSVNVSGDLLTARTR